MRNRYFLLSVFLLGFFVVIGAGSFLLNTNIIHAPFASDAKEIKIPDETRIVKEHELEALSIEKDEVLSSFATSTSSASALASAQVVIPSSTSVVIQESQSSNNLWNLINQHRVSIGRNNLQWHDGLCGYANKRKDTITGGSHSGFMQDNWQDYCPECAYMAETISRGYSDDSVVLSEWLESDSHRQHIEGDWTYGCVKYFDGNVVAAEFGR